MIASRSAGTGSHAQSADEPSFTKALCRTNRVWAVDATEREELPEGWQALASDLFADIAAVMAERPAGMLVVRVLREEGGGLGVDIRPVGRTADATRAFRAVQSLIEGARRTSERTCAVCGGYGRVRSVAERFVTLCEQHADEVPTGQGALVELGPEAGKHGRHLAGGVREDELTPGGAHAPAAATWDHRLYDLAHVEAALGRRRGRETSNSSATCTGDPDDAGRRDVDSDQQAYLRSLLADGEAGCRRALAAPGPMSLAGLDHLQARAPHMIEAVAFVRRHLQAASAMGLPTSFPALMVLGEPGSGKSWFLSRLAALLGLPFRRYSMSGQSLADGLVGAYPTWRNAQPGLVAKTLLAERVANPLLLVDEVDKARSHQMEDPYRGFYDLLEPEGARSFTDEYLGFPMDASRVLWVLAGNDLAPLPAPIVDRLTVVIVPAPDEAHLRAVAASIYEDCNEARRRFFPPSLDDGVIARLLETNPRGIRKAISEAMTRTASEGRRELRADDVAVPAPPRRAIGFR